LTDTKMLTKCSYLCHSWRIWQCFEATVSTNFALLCNATTTEIYEQNILKNVIKLLEKLFFQRTKDDCPFDDLLK